MRPSQVFGQALPEPATQPVEVLKSLVGRCKFAEGQTVPGVCDARLSVARQAQRGGLFSTLLAVGTLPVAQEQSG